MACNTIAKLEYDLCQNNLGGIKNIWLANYKENAATVVENANEVSGFAADVTWYKYPIRKGTASMTSTYNTSTDGASYVSTELSLVFTRMETQKRVAMTSFALAEAMAVVEDSNGKYWFLGKDAPITLTAGGGETGTAKGDRNAYTATFTDESLTFPYEVTKSAAEKLPKDEDKTPSNPSQGNGEGGSSQTPGA